MQKRDSLRLEPVARLSGVGKSFGEVNALHNLDLELVPGQVTALLGPNGAGKTTAVRCLLGLTEPDRGTARVFGGDPKLPENRRRTGVMLQISGVPPTLRVREQIELFSSYYPAPMPVAEVLANAGLTALSERPFGELSGGERQRVLFALAICGNPDLLFLDEPTVGLDVETRRAFWSNVRSLVAEGRTVLLTTHYLEEADDLADRIVVIDHGRMIADGTPAEIKRRTAARRVRCRTALSTEQLLALPAAERVRTKGDGVEILTGNAEQLLRRLLEQDRQLSGLEVSGAGLEEAFLNLIAPVSNDDSQAQQSSRKGAA